MPAGSILESETATAPRRSRAEPIWAAAARQGLDATVVSARRSFPSALPEERRFARVLRPPAHAVRRLPERWRRATASYTRGRRSLGGPRGWLGPLPAHTGEVREFAVEDAGSRIDGLAVRRSRRSRGGFRHRARRARPRSARRRHAQAAAAAAPIPTRSAPSRCAWPEGARALLPALLAGRGRLAARCSTARRPTCCASSSRGSSGGARGDGRLRRATAPRTAYEEGQLGPPLWARAATEPRRSDTSRPSPSPRASSRACTSSRTTARAGTCCSRTCRIPDEPLHLWLGPARREPAGPRPGGGARAAALSRRGAAHRGRARRPVRGRVGPDDDRRRRLRPRA